MASQHRREPQPETGAAELTSPAELEKLAAVIRTALNERPRYDDDVCVSKRAALERYLEQLAQERPDPNARPITPWQANEALTDWIARLCAIEIAAIRARCLPDPVETCELRRGCYAEGAAGRLAAAIEAAGFAAATVSSLAAFLASTVAAHTSSDQYVIAAHTPLDPDNGSDGETSLVLKPDGSVVGNTVMYAALQKTSKTVMCCAPVRSGHAAAVRGDAPAIVTYDIWSLLGSACKADAEANAQCAGAWILEGPRAAACVLGAGGYCVTCGVLPKAPVPADVISALAPLRASPRHAGIKKLIAAIKPPPPPAFKLQQKEKPVGSYPACFTCRRFVDAHQAADLDMVRPKTGRR